MEIIYDKLVHDNIPEIIKSNGGEQHFCKLNDKRILRIFIQKRLLLEKVIEK